MHSKKFETLDALRGLAAITVAFFHFSPDWAGHLAVDFFLVLSGFVLSHNYLYKDHNITPAEFISHRLARLYPLHFFTLVTFILVSLLVDNSFPGTFFALIQNITLTQNIGFNPDGLTYNFPSWSISVEFWVNVIFIFFVARSTKSSIIFFISFLGILIIYGNTGHLDTHSTNYFTFLNSGFVRGLTSFLLGILSYRIYLFYKGSKNISKNINYLEWFCVLCVFLLVFGRKDKLGGIDIFAPFLFMLLVAVFTFETGFLSRFLKKFKYLGEISYSIYLNQITVIILIRYLGPKIDAGIITMLVTYLFVLIIYSHFTYQYIEKPLKEKARNLLSRITSA